MGGACAIGALSLYPHENTVGVILVGAEQEREAEEPCRPVVAAKLDRIDDADDLRAGVKTLCKALFDRQRLWGQGSARGAWGVLVTRPDDVELADIVLKAIREAVGNAIRLTLKKSLHPVGVNVKTGDILDQAGLRFYKKARFDADMKGDILAHQGGDRFDLTGEARLFFEHATICGVPTSPTRLEAGCFRRDPVMPVVDSSQPNWKKAYGIIL